MEIQNLSLNDALEIIKNPEQNTLIIWYAVWSGFSVCYLRNLDQMPEIENVKVYKIDIDNPLIESNVLNKLGISSIPTSFFLKKGVDGYGYCKKISHSLNYEEILKHFGV